MLVSKRSQQTRRRLASCCQKNGAGICKHQASNLRVCCFRGALSVVKGRQATQFQAATHNKMFIIDRILECNLLLIIAAVCVEYGRRHTWSAQQSFGSIQTYRLRRYHVAGAWRRQSAPREPCATYFCSDCVEIAQ